MKLWLLTQDSTGGYDTYDSCVVAADSEEAAKRIHPSGWETGEWWLKYSSSEEGYFMRDWALPASVDAQCIGEAAEGLAAGVICSSFNAG